MLHVACRLSASLALLALLEILDLLLWSKVQKTKKKFFLQEKKKSGMQRMTQKIEK
jgi:uncharacterized membrane protein